MRKEKRKEEQKERLKEIGSNIFGVFMILIFLIALAVLYFGSFIMIFIAFYLKSFWNVLYFFSLFVFLTLSLVEKLK